MKNQRIFEEGLNLTHNCNMVSKHVLSYNLHKATTHIGI